MSGALHTVFTQSSLLHSVVKVNSKKLSIFSTFEAWCFEPWNPASKLSEVQQHVLYKENNKRKKKTGLWMGGVPGGPNLEGRSTRWASVHLFESAHTDSSSHRHTLVLFSLFSVTVEIFKSQGYGFPTIHYIHRHYEHFTMLVSSQMQEALVAIRCQLTSPVLNLKTLFFGCFLFVLLIFSQLN